ncbi:MAG: phosphoglycerate dehydrogenase [Albidovulum sp.]|nr:phosphoglycerate dehydrogenase [Albidovulum sp.]
MTLKVLVSDKLAESAVETFRSNGIDVSFEPQLGKDKSALAEAIGEFDGLAIRSGTKVTSKLLESAGRLRVIGRAGIGVDNIDVSAASMNGILVMNTPFGNSITTAEHTIAMMMALARQIPEASHSVHGGNWEKSRFMGMELFGKTLGVIGCGNVGAPVCRRAIGLGMKVVGCDPFLSAQKARELGIEKVELVELLRRSDIVTLHLPLIEKTRRILNANSLAIAKRGVRIVNCARGGLVDEAALADAIRSGHVAGAAVDVFDREPPEGSPLIGLPGVVATPHLGASTTEAQEKVAIQVAEQMSDFLLRGAISNAVNMPSISAEESPLLMPWIALAEHLGSFVGQMTDEPIRAVNLLYNGAVASMNTAALNASATVGLLRHAIAEVSMVSAQMMAKDRGISISTTTQSKSGVFDAYVKLTVVTKLRERSIAGTVFSDGKPRFIQIKGINIDAEIEPNMLYTTHGDVPGIVGALGTILGKRDINIANFTLGRTAAKSEAIALLSVDEPVNAEVAGELKDTGLFLQVRPLQFRTASIGLR